MGNNIFNFATKELSQDAMICWLVNWINSDEPKYKEMGKAFLDLLLGANARTEGYHDVRIKTQFNKIDVFIEFNGKYILIVEDKVNTSEHSEQIKRYKEKIEGKAEYSNHKIYTTYFKTGIFYDVDKRTKVNNVVNLEDLLNTLSNFENVINSEILASFVNRLKFIKQKRDKIDQLILDGKYANAFSVSEGQFKFLDKIFSDRDINKNIGYKFKSNVQLKSNNPIEYIDHIYSEGNLDGSPWTQYCFWGKQHLDQLANDKAIEYQFLFWRIDCQSDGRYYISLRHYDYFAKTNQQTRNRKIKYYEQLRSYCDEKYTKNGKDIFKKFGERKNYKESDLLFIPTERIDGAISFEELKHKLQEITKDIYAYAEALEI